MQGLVFVAFNHYNSFMSQKVFCSIFCFLDLFVIAFRQKGKFLSFKRFYSLSLLLEPFPSNSSHLLSFSSVFVCNSLSSQFKAVLQVSFIKVAISVYLLLFVIIFCCFSP
jgi:hypothetical protein